MIHCVNREKSVRFLIRNCAEKKCIFLGMSAVENCIVHCTFPSTPVGFLSICMRFRRKFTKNMRTNFAPATATPSTHSLAFACHTPSNASICHFDVSNGTHIHVHMPIPLQYAHTYMQKACLTFHKHITFHYIDNQPTDRPIQYVCVLARCVPSIRKSILLLYMIYAG